MRLADRIAQCRRPFVVRRSCESRLIQLNNTADFADAVLHCPIRYVLSDDLTRLCADLAYSTGARSIACADLVHVPAETVWIEWCIQPWRQALHEYGFPLIENNSSCVGRRGALVHATRDGRRGLLRTFWTPANEQDVLASSMEAYFDFDTPEGEVPEAPDGREGQVGQVCDETRSEEDMLGRCFRFRYEESWSDYYRRAGMTSDQENAVWHYCLGTIAMDIPMLLAFFLLLGTRTGLPQQRPALERVNRQRVRAGKVRLLDHVEVRSPLLPECRDATPTEWHGTRRHPRLHHVRGHLVRRGNQIFWRVPHLRGRARFGAIQTRTVVWTYDAAAQAGVAPSRDPPSDAPASLAVGGRCEGHRLLV